jgi:hypothetical protein
MDTHSQTRHLGICITCKSIHNSNMNTITRIGVEGYNVLYIDVSLEQFIEFLNNSGRN